MLVDGRGESPRRPVATTASNGGYTTPSLFPINIDPNASAAEPPVYYLFIGFRTRGWCDDDILSHARPELPRAKSELETSIPTSTVRSWRGAHEPRRARSPAARAIHFVR